jgi:hypothetical protein
MGSINKVVKSVSGNGGGSKRASGKGGFFAKIRDAMNKIDDKKNQTVTPEAAVADEAVVKDASMQDPNASVSTTYDYETSIGAGGVYSKPKQRIGLNRLGGA